MSIAACSWRDFPERDRWLVLDRRTSLSTSTTGESSLYLTDSIAKMWKAAPFYNLIKLGLIYIQVIYEDNVRCARCACPRKAGNSVEVRCGSLRTVTPLGRRIAAPAHPLHAHHDVLLCEWTSHAPQTAPAPTSDSPTLVSSVLNVSYISTTSVLSVTSYPCFISANGLDNQSVTHDALLSRLKLCSQAQFIEPSYCSCPSLPPTLLYIRSSIYIYIGFWIIILVQLYDTIIRQKQC